MTTYSNLDQYGAAFRRVDQQVVTRLFMQQMLNWLVATRFDLESEKSLLVARHGRSSNQVEEFEHATHDAYDGHPGYRFMYKLRDFAQHGGTPLSGLLVQSSSSGGSELVPHLRREALLEARFNWGTVRKQIEAGDEVIPLLPLAGQAMDGLRHIERVVVRHHAADVVTDAGVLVDAVERVSATEGHPAVFSLPAPDRDGPISWATLPSISSCNLLRITSQRAVSWNSVPTTTP